MGGLSILFIVILDENILGIPESLNLTLPGVGLTGCFIRTESQGIYLHIPIVCIMTINLLCFVIILCKVVRWYYHLSSHQGYMIFQGPEEI